MIAFAHGGTIRSALYAFTGWPEGSAWRFVLDNTSVTKVRVDGGRDGGLMIVNDTAHLEGCLGAWLEVMLG